MSTLLIFHIGTLAIVPSLDWNLQQWIQTFSWVAAAIATAIGFFKFLSELRQSRDQRELNRRESEEARKQRALDLRWKQSEAGKSLNDEIQDNPKAWAAMQMLDYPKGRRYELSEGNFWMIKREGWLKALADEPKNDTEADDPVGDYIRDSFDAFFYYLVMLNHSITIGLVQLEDVSYPLSYYLPKFKDDTSTVRQYLIRNELKRALEAFDRFSSLT